MTTYGAKFQISPSELCFFKGKAGYLVLILHLTQFLATGGPYKQARCTHIIVIKPHSDIFSCHGTFN